MAAIWEDRFGFAQKRLRVPLVVGELGGTYTGADRQWQDAAVEYMRARGIGLFYFALNPQSDDTGGLLKDDMTTPEAAKLKLLSRLRTTPSSRCAPRDDRRRRPEAWFRRRRRWRARRRRRLPSHKRRPLRARAPMPLGTSRHPEGMRRRNRHGGRPRPSPPPPRPRRRRRRSQSGYNGRRLTTMRAWRAARRRLRRRPSPFRTASPRPSAFSRCSCSVGWACGLSSGRRAPGTGARGRGGRDSAARARAARGCVDTANPEARRGVDLRRRRDGGTGRVSYDERGGGRRGKTQHRLLGWR